MPQIEGHALEATIYVLRGFEEHLKNSIGHRAFSIRFPEPKESQRLVSAVITTIPDMLPQIIQELAKEGIPYDVHRKDGGTGIGRFDEYGKFHVSAALKDKTTISRDWDNQEEYRKRWATLKLINLIEDKPCEEKATAPSPWKTRNPILRGKSDFSQMMLTGYGKP